jgi:hypothetical protein
MAASPYKRADLVSLVGLLAHSPIVATGLNAPPGVRHCELPASYELTDVLVLDWIVTEAIVAETMRARRNYLPH